MSFDRTIAGIDSIKQKGNISVDELYDIIVCVLEDAYEVGGTEGISELPVNDEELYARKMNRIISALVNSYDEKKDSLVTLRENLRERCKTHRESIDSVQSELTAVGTDILEANRVKADLDATREKLQAERGHLLDAAKENERLNKEIERLSDPNLDKIADKNKGLEEELKKRQEREGQLNAEKESLETEIEKITKKLDELNSEISLLKKKEYEQKASEEEAKEIKAGHERGIENIKKKIAELDEWIKNVSSTQGKLNEERSELQNNVNILISVWNKFSKNEQGARILSNEEYAEIPKWFEERISEVNDIISQIQKRYQILVDESEKQTK